MPGGDLGRQPARATTRGRRRHRREPGPTRIAATRRAEQGTAATRGAKRRLPATGSATGGRRARPPAPPSARADPPAPGGERRHQPDQPVAPRTRDQPALTGPRRLDDPHDSRFGRVGHDDPDPLDAPGPAGRLTWTTTRRASRSCACTASRGIPARAPRASNRAGTSSGPLACSVLIPPSCPVLSAASSSRTSAPRTSPTTSRSGRIRSACRTRSTRVTAPTPSTLAPDPAAGPRAGARGRARARPRRRRSARSAGHSAIRAASTVVFPAPVPPVTTSETRAATSSAAGSRRSGVTAPSRTSASTPPGRCRANRRLRCGPPSASGRQHGVESDTTGQHAVDPRLGVVESATGEPGQPHGERPQVVDRHPHRRPARRPAHGRPRPRRHR